MRWALGLLGLGVCALFYGHAAASLEAARRAGAYLPFLLLAPSVGMALHAFAWCALLPAELRPERTGLFRAQVVASAGNWLGAGVLGEPAKLAHLEGKRRQELYGWLGLDNLIQLVSTLLFVVGAACALPCLGARATLRSSGSALWIQLLPGGVERWTPCAVALMCVLVVVVALRLERRRAQASERERVPLLRTLSGILLHFIGKSWIVVEFALVLAALAWTSTWSPTQPMALICVSFSLASVLTAMLGAFVPAQLGALEGVLSVVGAHLGVPLHVVLAVVLLRRLRSLVWLGVGALLAEGLVPRVDS